MQPLQCFRQVRVVLVVRERLKDPVERNIAEFTDSGRSGHVSVGSRSQFFQPAEVIHCDERAVVLSKAQVTPGKTFYNCIAAAHGVKRGFRCDLKT